MIPRVPLGALAYGSLLLLAPVGIALAQDDGSSAANAPVTVNPATTQNGQGGQSGQNGQGGQPGQPALPADSTSSDNSANNSRAQVPDVQQTPANRAPTNIPLFPPQLGNPVSPYTSSSVNSQSPQITQPTLYLTGVRDVSQISTNGALAAAFSQQDTQGADIYGDESIMNVEHPPIERLRIGPFDVKTALVTSAVADDNFRGNNSSDNNTKKSDITFTVTPALYVVYGLHDGQKGYATLTYTPNITRLYHDSAEDTDDQNVAFNAIYAFQRLTLNFTETYTETSGVNTDTSQRTTQNTSATNFGATYQLDEKLFVSSQLEVDDSTFSGNQSGQGSGGDNSGGVGDTNTSINTNINYRLSEKLTLGPSFNVGWDDPNGQQKSTYEQVLAGLNYTPTEKIGLNASAGAETRQYDQGGGDQINPVFSLGMGYNPFDSTTLSLSASQAVHTSTAPIGQPTNGQTVVTSSVGASATQRVVQRVFVNFVFSYNHDENSNEGGGNGGNSDSGKQDTFTYRSFVNFAPTQWSSVSVYYQYLTTVSDFQGQSYNDNQVGVSVSAQF